MVMVEKMHQIVANGSSTERKFEGLQLENGDCTSPTVLPKYKRRKVSAVRDFPPGCGRLAPRINMKPMEAMGFVGTDENPVGRDMTGAVLETDSIKRSGTGVESHSPEGLQSLVSTEVLKSSNDLDSNVEKLVVLSNKVDRPELLNDEPVGVEMPTAPDNSGLIDQLKALECETSEQLKDSHKVEVAALAEDMAESSHLKLLSLPNRPLTNGNVSEKTVTRNYPPRRRISAIRDFPPFCGRNAPRLNEEDCLKTPASSKSKSLDQEKSGVEEKLLKEISRTDVKQMGDDVQEEGNLKKKGKESVSKNFRDKVKAESEGDGTKEARKLVESGTSSEIRADWNDKREKSPRPPQKSDLRHPECKSQTDSKEDEMEVGNLEGEVGKEIVVYNGRLGGLERKVPKDMVVYNGEVGGLEGKVGQEIVVHTEDKNLKRKFSGLSDSKNQFQIEDASLESAMDRVVVQGLMAGPNCPWRKGKVEKVIMVHTEDKILKRKFSGLSASENQFQSEDVSGESAMGRVVVLGLMAAPKCSRRQGSEEKKHDLSSQEKARYFFRTRKAGPENLGGKHMKDKSASTGKAACHGVHELVVRDDVDSHEHHEEHKGFHVGRRSHDFDVKLPRYFFRARKAGTENLGGMKNKSASTGKAACHGMRELVVRDDVDSLEHHEEREGFHVGCRSHDFDVKLPRYIFRARKPSTENLGGKHMKNKSASTGNAACHGMHELVARDDVDSLEHHEEHEGFHVGCRSHDFDGKLPPLDPSSSNGKGDDREAIVTRKKVRDALRMFQTIRRKLLLEAAAKSKKEKKVSIMVNLEVARILKDKGKCVNRGKQILGPVPGVEVGDEFQYRAELATIGLHCQFQAGIDYIEQDGKVLAASVVSFGGYANELDNSDVLIFTGIGGNVMGKEKKREDQKLERGNLALKNSIDERNPVRVIRGFRGTIYKGGERVSRYIYDGLYLVKKCWQEVGPHGKLVFKFHLGRIPGQPELAVSDVKKSKKLKIREGLCVDDISQGKELIPICVVNTVDDEKPPPFNYITSMIYPNWYSPIPLAGCDCTGGCSDSETCSCAVRNGGEIPFNFSGAIVEAKRLVYECSPSCKCSPSCHNRVSQRGINFQLEIFKTESRGWGVRSLNSIPSGSFICELLGELLEDEEADQRTSNDEYLFDIGQNYNDHTLWDGLSNLMLDAQSSSCEVAEDGGFTIDAARYGNVGRFINHSCSPNLYAQNVLYDHVDRRMPHIMLFAAENIPPLQELTYHYNYTIDQVRDSHGNIKKKSCYCGSSECAGRMY